MNPEKRNDFHLTGGIHTFSIKYPQNTEPIPQHYIDNGIIKASSRHENGEIVTTSIINPNKLAGEIFSYGDFNIAVESILNGAGIEGDMCKMIRCDMRYDSYENEHYKSYQKLNRLLISLLKCEYSVRNAYKTDHLITDDRISMAIKSNMFEAEAYDKDYETGGKDLAKSRFEVRSKKWNNNDIPEEFLVKWFNRWDKAIKRFDDVQMMYNDALEKRYKESLGARPCQYRTLTDFLIANQERIFTSKQMIDLLSRFDEVGSIEKAKERAKYHKKKYGIEYFSKADVEYAINEIKRATTKFFEE